MSFESNTPQHIAECELSIRQLYTAKERLQLGTYGHDCDCEYCDREGEDAIEAVPEDVEKAEELFTEIQAYEATIKKLKAWQEFVDKKPSPLT